VPATRECLITWAMVFTCVFLMMGCERILESSVENTNSPTLAQFRKLRGYKLHYDIYLPSTWTGWVHKEHCLFRFDPETESYIIDNIVIGQEEVDDLGSRFKISSKDWRYQFGFGHHGVSLNESTLGVTLDGVVVRIGFSNSGRSDMRIEFAENEFESMLGRHLVFELKVLDESPSPEALLYVSPVDSKLTR